MNNKPQPIWHSIESMPILAGLIDGELIEVKEQYSNLLKARNRPYVLNDAIVQRTINVFTEQFDYIWVFEAQLLKWKEEEPLTPIQQKEVDRLQEKLKELSKSLTDLLALAEELKTGTIEKVMGKSDLELGLEYLKNSLK